MPVRETVFWSAAPTLFVLVYPPAVECVWVGPDMVDYVCNNCILGYEAISPEDPTCHQPKFGPHKHWEDSPERSQLSPRSENGAPMPRNDNTSAPILLTQHTYVIPAPQLEPKARKFAGYKQPHSITNLIFRLVRTSGWTKMSPRGSTRIP